MANYNLLGQNYVPIVICKDQNVDGNYIRASVYLYGVQHFECHTTYITFGARGLNFLVYCNQEVGSTSVEV
jgi:hypothetical protein